MHRISFEWLEYAFECFESSSNGWNLHSNSLNPFEWLELAFSYFERFSIGWNWHSNASNLVQMVRVGIRMLRIPFEWLKLAFKCFESCSNGWNWHFNTSNAFWLVGISIRMFQMAFKWLELAFECFESRSIVRIGIRMIRIPFYVRILFDLGKYFSKVLATQFYSFKKFSWPSARFCDSVT